MKPLWICLLVCWVGKPCIAQNLPITHCEGNKCALVDAKTLQPLTPYRYDYIEAWQEGMALATLQDSKGKNLHTFLNEKGQELLTPTPNQLFPFVEGMAIFREKNKFGFIDKLGRVAVPADYAETANYSEGMARVRSEAGKFHFIDKTGAIVFEVPDSYTFLDDQYKDGLLRVCTQTPAQRLLHSPYSRDETTRQGAYAYLDHAGKEVLNVAKALPTLQPIYCSAFVQGVAIVGITKDTLRDYPQMQYGVIDKQGNILVPFEYEQIYQKGNDLLLQMQEKTDFLSRAKIGVFQLQNRKILPAVYAQVHSLSGKYRPVEYYKYTPTEAQTQKYEARYKMLPSIVDSTGKEILPTRFYDAFLSTQGQILATEDSILRTYQLYDIAGKPLSKPDSLLFCSYYFTEEGGGEERKVGFALMYFQQKWALFDVEKQAIVTDWADEFAPSVGKLPLAEIAYRQGKTWHLLNQTFDQATAFGEEAFAPVRKGKKWGLLHKVGKLTTPYQYDSIVPALTRPQIQTIESFRVNTNYTGRMRKKDTEWIETLQTLFLPKNHFLACQNKKWGVINGFGKVITPFENDSIVDVFYDYLVVRRGGRQGLIDYAGKPKTPFFTGEFAIENEILYVQEKDGVTLYDTEGNRLTPKSYTKINKTRFGYFYAWQGDKQGLLDSEGKEVIAPIYDEVRISQVEKLEQSREEGKPIPATSIVIFVKKDNKEGFINDKFELVLSCQYEHINHYTLAQMDLLIVFGNEKYGVFTNTGKPVVPIVYDALAKFGTSHILATQEGKMGVLDSVGKAHLPVEYDLLQLCEDSVYALKNKTLYVYTYQLQKVFEQTYQDLLPLQEFCFENYLIGAKNNNKWGFINRQGKALVPFVYDEISEFCNFRNGNQYAKVRQGKRWGIIDTAGKLLVPFEYEAIEPLQNWQGLDNLKGTKKGKNIQIIVKPIRE